jgi:hypothetical protein
MMQCPDWRHGLTPFGFLSGSAYNSLTERMPAKGRQNAVDRALPSIIDAVAVPRTMPFRL